MKGLAVAYSTRCPEQCKEMTILAIFINLSSGLSNKTLEKFLEYYCYLVLFINNTLIIQAANLGWKMSKTWKRATTLQTPKNRHANCLFLIEHTGQKNQVGGGVGVSSMSRVTQISFQKTFRNAAKGEGERHWSRLLDREDHLEWQGEVTNFQLNDNSILYFDW